MRRCDIATWPPRTIKVVSRGRITVPADIRQRLHMEAGDLIGFYEEDGRIVAERLPHAFDHEIASNASNTAPAASLDVMDGNSDLTADINDR